MLYDHRQLGSLGSALEVSFELVMTLHGNSETSVVVVVVVVFAVSAAGVVAVFAVSAVEARMV